eukprot:1976958-Rhodomonas_salina.1
MSGTERAYAATDRLMLARRILKWTYVVCFYEPSWYQPPVVGTTSLWRCYEAQGLGGCYAVSSTELVYVAIRVRRMVLLDGAVWYYGVCGTEKRMVLIDGAGGCYGGAFWHGR